MTRGCLSSLLDNRSPDVVITTACTVATTLVISDTTRETLENQRLSRDNGPV